MRGGETCGQRDCDLFRCRHGFPVRLSHFFELWALFLAPVIQNTDEERNDGMWRWAGPGWALQAPLSGIPTSDYRPCSGPCPCGTHHRSDQGKGPHKARLPHALRRTNTNVTPTGPIIEPPLARCMHWPPSRGQGWKQLETRGLVLSISILYS